VTSGNQAPTIAPGAENVGQAQIVTEFSKPFQLEGLFGAADVGAFGNENGEMPMDADEDGDVFFDAEEGPMEDDTSVFILLRLSVSGLLTIISFFFFH
jgi:nuclear GTP-binding protein